MGTDKHYTARHTESLLPKSSGSGTRARQRASWLHHEPDATVEEAQRQWTHVGQAEGATRLGPGLGLALGTAAFLSGPGRRRSGLPVQKSERFSSCCLASSSMRDASQQHDCPFFFKRGTVRFLKSLIYSGAPHHPLLTPLPPHTSTTSFVLQPNTPPSSAKEELLLSPPGAHCLYSHPASVQQAFTVML